MNPALISFWSRTIRRRKAGSCGFERLQLTERCVVVNDGEEAIDFLYSNGRFRSALLAARLVLLDLKMPRMNGFDLLERMKTDAALNSFRSSR
jgi:CheY-like chemotaxis protein